jgi:hypothetical protein
LFSLSYDFLFIFGKEDFVFSPSKGCLVDSRQSFFICYYTQNNLYLYIIQ